MFGSRRPEVDEMPRIILMSEFMASYVTMGRRSRVSGEASLSEQWAMMDISTC